MVNIMTLHGAKGLEFDCVFLAGWEEGLFPSQRSLDEGGTKALEEERRLAYVGITRARRQCTISFAANRRVYGQWSSSIPSRFVDELPGAISSTCSATRPAGPTTSRCSTRAVRQPRAVRRAGKGKLIEGRAEIMTTGPPPAAGSSAVGQRIFHDKFGYGAVQVVDGDRLEIAFEKAGTKKVVDSFVQPA